MIEPQYTNNLGYWIKQYSRLANQAMDTELKPYGLGRTQWYVLYHIQESKTLSQRKLQDILNVESATLTSLIATLVRKGLIAQAADVRDKRSKILELTPEGKALWRKLPDPIEAIKTKALRHIAAKDIEQARTVIEQAVHNLEQEK